MAYERIMGIDVINESVYQEYRVAMTPILASYDGFFSFDFKVSEVLITKSEDNINRLFIITFPTKKDMELFFSCPEYLAVRKQYFDKSVKGSTMISLHEVE